MAINDAPAFAEKTIYPSDIPMETVDTADCMEAVDPVAVVDPVAPVAPLGVRRGAGNHSG